MKKKMEKDDHKQKRQHQSIDNKDNIEHQDAGSDIQESLSSEDKMTETGPETNSTGSLPADKVVAEDKNFEEKLSEMQDKYLRLSAEFDNYRKRTLREKMDMSKYAGENLLIKILPIMDDFERALKHMDNTADCGAIKEGIDLIYGKLAEFLKQNGVTAMDPLNQSFNVDIHEAVAKIQVEEEEKKGRVLDIVQKGYYLQDKVLRYSKVVVGE